MFGFAPRMDRTSPAYKGGTQAIKLVRQNVRSLLQQKETSFGGHRGIGFEDRLVFCKSKRPTRE
jgi:hypothetical protein